MLIINALIIEMEVSQTASQKNIQTRESFLRLKCPFRQSNAGQMALSYIGSSVWSKTPWHA